MNPKIILALMVGGLLVGAGYYLRDTTSNTLSFDSSRVANNSCGPNGCGDTTMMHDIAITDEKVFIKEMIPHHQEAIDTSNIIMAQTTDPELKKFAQAVITGQTAEVNQMKGWLKTWFKEEYVASSSYLPMMGDLSQFTGRDLDKVYVAGMIRHHQGAIDMARKVLQLNPRPEIKKMADDIIAVQATEVATLQGWLDTKYQGVEAKDEMNHMMNIH